VAAEGDVLMAAIKVIPVILSGGSGTRLWPLSRSAKPKQFLSFDGGPTMIQQTLLRCQGAGFDGRLIFVGADQHRFVLAEAAQGLGVQADIVLEPMRRDSCAAIVAGALQAMARDEEAVILVLAADHHVPDAAAFAACVAEAVPAAEAGLLVTFGIKPRSPATGYGYIMPGEVVAGGVKRLQKFVEKPDHATAVRYIADGYLWNSGNFLYKAKSFIAEAKVLVPDVVAAVAASLTAAERDLDFIRLNAEAFARSPQIAVDFAIMEKTARAAVLPVSYEWNDIGSWDAVAGSLPADANGNAIVGDGVVEASRNVFVHSEGMLTTVLGCDDIVVVTTRDAVLVAKRGATEKVKGLVDQLKAAGRESLL
jgi:mannose-1-phosphate guanylyltransferase / mannose-6-phosphate isomerase